MDPAALAERQARQDEAFRLYAAGHSYAEIARQLGLASHHNSVWHIVSAGATRAGQHPWRWQWEARPETPRKVYYFIPPPPPPPPPVKGRPLDMGGPRDVWLERSPWDDR